MLEILLFSFSINIISLLKEIDYNNYPEEYYTLLKLAQAQFILAYYIYGMRLIS